jgi:hypothetical protein
MLTNLSKTSQICDFRPPVMTSRKQVQKCFEMNQDKLLTRELRRLRGALLTKELSDTTG